ncbi:MAG: peptidase M23 [Deltaproteobacteria bacterium]|nr:peptidase M23 [Deltaproteobacteria bacterium]
MQKRLFIFLILLSSFLTTSARGADVKRQLQGINKEIKEKKQLIDKTIQVESKVSGELAKIDSSLKEKEASLTLLNRDLKVVESGIEKSRREIDVVQKDAETRKLLIQKRLVAVYKSGDVGNVRIFFSSESFPQMLENLRYMKAMLEKDRQLVAAYNERIEKLKELKRKLASDARGKENLKGNIESRKHEIEVEKERKASLLNQVREDKKNYQVSLRELEANSRRLHAIMVRLEAASRKSYTVKARKQTVKEAGKDGKAGKVAVAFVPPTSSSGFASQKGRLSLPAQGRIVGSFGRHKHPEFNSYTNSNGISISASSGADVRAVYGGRIVFADYFKGYGNMVIVDHGDGFFSLYAHNSRVLKRTGANVAKNEVLASVGDVDSTKGPVLYFEIRYQGRPIDPTPWVR